jgi:hypothetical protein
MQAKRFGILLGVLLFVLPLPASADQKISGLIEGQMIRSGGSANPWTQTLVNYNLGKKTGLYLFAQTGASWRQVYVGPTYSPASWMQVGAAYGIERDTNPGRFGSFAWFGKGPVSLLALYEDGGSGPWHKVVANYAIGKAGIGAMHQAFLGVGPRVELRFGKYTAWGAVLKNGAKKNQTFAVNYNF